MNRYESFNPNITYDETPETPSEPKDDENQEQGRKPRERRQPKEKKKKKEPKKEAPKSADGESFAKRLADFFKASNLRLIIGIFLGCFATYLLFAFISFTVSCIADQSEVNNLAVGTAMNISNTGGEGGARLAQFLIDGCFGLPSAVIIFWMYAMCLKAFGVGIRFKSVDFTIKCLVALIALSLLTGLLTIGFDTPVNWGGLHGRYVNEFVLRFTGWVGAAALGCFLLGVFVVLCLRDVIKWFLKIRRKRAEIAAKRHAKKLAEEQRKAELQELVKKENEENEAISNAEVDMPQPEESPEENIYVHFDDDEEHPEVADEPQPTDDDAQVTNDDSAGLYVEEDDEPEAESEEPEAETLEETTSEEEQPMLVNVNQIAEGSEKQQKTEELNHWIHPYRFPPYALLKEGTRKTSVDETEQLENEDRIRRTLDSYDVKISSIVATVGPTVTLYEVIPDKGVKIAKIRNLSDDIALSLKAKTGVRIIAPIPGKGTVGIEVANKDPQTVQMRTVLQSRVYQESKYRLPIAIGSTISNEVYITDLAKMPHLLVAGATGQGKSVGLNAIITSLLYAKSPDELKFVMIDPKQVEFAAYEKIENHYLAKIPECDDAIITDMSKVVPTLSSLCVEMEDRYTLLRKAHCKNIDEYNPLVLNKKLNPTEGHRFMPYIVLVVDEFADLIAQAGAKEVETPISRLAAKARAIGIHVILATQRPSVDVITGVIKSNFPARIAFKVSAGGDSKTILDTTGAQQLIGRGDMLIRNNSDLVRVQCALVENEEVESIVDYISKQPYAQGPYPLPEPLVADGNNAGADSVRGNNFGDRDPLFDEIARWVVNSSTASTSSLQRRYSIGFNRAGKIMDQLEAAGIVGAAQDGKPRSVLIDPIGLESILNS